VSRWKLRIISVLSLGLGFYLYVYLTAVTQLRVSICDNFKLDNPDPNCTAWPPWLAGFCICMLTMIVTLVVSFWPARRRADARARSR